MPLALSPPAFARPWPRFGEARRSLLDSPRRRRQPLALVAGLGILAGSLGACDVTIREDGDVSVSHLQGRATQEWNRTYPLTAGGRVEVVNTNGPIEVVVGPAGTVEVEVALDARSMTDERAKQLLNESKIEERVTQEHIRLANVRRDETLRGLGNMRRGRLEVAYKVTVPADARVEMTGNNGTLKADGLRGHVKAMVANGGIELTGLRGSVDAASVNGAISVKMAEVTGSVRLESTNGRIALEIPKDTKATLNVRSVNGGITVTGLTTQEAEGRRIRNLESVLNGGGPEIEVRVTNGRITITGQ
jgi:putative adhesin